MNKSAALLALGLTGGLLLAAGCTQATEPTRTQSPAPAETVAPSPTPDVRDELVAALERSQGVAYRYAVRGSLPKGKSVEGSGALDLKRQRFQTTISVTGGENPSAGSRIVVGTDSYQRPSDDGEWVHVDLNRVEPDDLFVGFDWADPIGMKAFTASIFSAQRTGTHTYTGRFRPGGTGIKSFLPVGAPSIVTIAMPLSPFTITTDDQGWVTSIEVELTPSDGPKLTTTTTMSDHGKPLKINAPARSVEAADFYYRE